MKRFIGEESTVAKVEFTDDPVWIIDPVDGTTNFVHRFPYCAISIAFYVNKQVGWSTMHAGRFNIKELTID